MTSRQERMEQETEALRDELIETICSHFDDDDDDSNMFSVSTAALALALATVIKGDAQDKAEAMRTIDVLVTTMRAHWDEFTEEE